MSNSELPQRTAGEITLPNGDTVWVCTLNSLLYEEADTEARWYAQAQARVYLKGGSRYVELQSQMRERTPEVQAAYIVQQDWYQMRRDVEEKNPLPDRPDQGEQTPEVFTKSVIEWEETCKKIEEKRQKAFSKRYQDEIKRNTSLTAANRLERACVAHFAQQWSAEFVKRRDIETLYRAVRLADDHYRRYFPTAEAVKDADDSVQAALRDFYYVTLAVPKSEDVPTSPDVS